MEFITYVLQACLDKYVDGVEFAADCKSIKELASRTLIEVCKDLCPSKEFEDLYESGQRDYDSTDCLDLAAYVIRYYLNGETTIQDNTPDSDMGIVAMFNTAADWALAKVGSLFGYRSSNYSSSPTEVWKKAYDTIFQVLPLNLFWGTNANSSEGVEDLFMNRLIGGALDFVVDTSVSTPTGINKILSLFGRRTDSELNKTLPQFVITLLGRIINPLFGLLNERDFYRTYTTTSAQASAALNLIIPYTYTTLDQVITVKNNVDGELSLTNTAYRLLLNLPYTHADTNSLLYQAMPLVMQIMGLWGYDTYPYIPNEASGDFPIYSGQMLEALVNQYAETVNDDLSYDDPNYSYFHMVDFQPFLYLDFKSIRNTAEDLVAQYKGALKDPYNETTNPEGIQMPTREDMTNAAYRLTRIADMLNNSYRNGSTTYYGETTAINYQLNKVLNQAAAANYTQANENVEGAEKTYTERTWNAYKKALTFAQLVNQEYNAAASLTNATARANALRDMRQSRINTARKMLMKAMADLKAWIPLADYSQLDNSVAVVDYIESLRMFQPEAIQEAIDAYLAARNVDRDYDRDSQYLIDKLQTDLDDVLNGMGDRLIDYLYLYTEGDGGQYIDENNSYLYGLEQGFATGTAFEEVGNDFDVYMQGYYGMGTAATGEQMKLGIHPAGVGNGTGAVINMYPMDDDNNQHPSNTKYTVIIFGDVDGDSYADGRDAVLMRAYNSMMISDEQAGPAALYAGDLDVSGVLDMTDAKVCEKAGLFKKEINQTPEELTSRKFGIVDILGLRDAS
jgi:hypothetical protein